MARSLLFSAVGLLPSFLPLVAAQLFTDCNPLHETCPPDPALGTTHTFHFSGTAIPDNTWTTTAGRVEFDPEKGATFTIRQKGESPTLISNFYFFWGKTEVILKASPGQGIVSSIVWMSDLLDEVDWEFLGGQPLNASTNYFGKGEPDFRNAGYHLVEGGVQDDYHNYTSVWTKDQLDWYIDGNLVRTLLAKDANNTRNYPQTPMKLSLGIWAGGDPDLPQGTIDWAGGLTDFSKGPYSMYVKSAHVEDYSTGKEYIYTDHSGSWESIKIVEGNSTAAESINKEPEKSLGEKWDELPAGTKTGVYVGAGGLASVLVAALVFYYIKQRRAGAREAAMAEHENERERMEMERFRKSRGPDALAFDGVYASEAAKGPSVNVGYALPDSPPGSSAGPPEKEWDPTSNNSGAPPSMPLLGQQGRF
ncbi:hypothetical protein DL767_003337 [Monosporascus sp. MG133]|nr:hypothetical protein DL767_003337 [Monosporascus sp. MG133]